MKKVALNPKLMGEIVRIILRHEKVERIVLFGSRATGSAGLRSDIDLALFGSKLSAADVSLIRDELEEIRTPLKFDVVDFGRLKEKNLKKEILEEGVVIYESQTHQTAND